MKRAPLYVLAGTVAGFAGVLGFHSRPGSPATAVGRPAAGRSSGGSGQATPRPAAQGPSASPTGPVHAATGRLEQYGYGQLAVRVTLRGNRITGVSVPTIQTAEPYSQQLASQVIPTLRSQVLAGQTAHINGVSGATYTSEAYAMSLQSALDKLHLK